MRMLYGDWCLQPDGMLVSCLFTSLFFLTWALIRVIRPSATCSCHSTNQPRSPLPPPIRRTARRRAPCHRGRWAGRWGQRTRSRRCCRRRSRAGPESPVDGRPRTRPSAPPTVSSADGGYGREGPVGGGGLSLSVKRNRMGGSTPWCAQTMCTTDAHECDIFVVLLLVWWVVLLLMLL